ncbi:MAG: DUF4215 domain-containing protein [Myxococcota bacterium]
MRRVGSVGVVISLLVVGCLEQEPRDSASFSGVETSSAGLTARSTSGGFSNVAISAGTTIWFNSEVRYSGLPNDIVRLYMNGSRVTFSAGGTNYNLVVPDGEIVIDPHLTTASTTFNAQNNTWTTSVPAQYAGQTFATALAFAVPTNLPGSIANVTWTTNFESTAAFNLTWQWSAATYSSFTTNMTAVGVKPVDNQWINPYANSDTAGTPESFKNRLIPGARTGGGSNYIGVVVSQAGIQPDVPCAGVVCTPNAQCQTASACDVRTGFCVGTNRPDNTACNDGNACTTVDRCISGTCAGSVPLRCTAADACHTAGTCDAATGACSNPIAPNGTPCTDGNACTQSDSCQAGVCTGATPVVCTASDQCHVAGTCNPGTGVCSNPAAANGTSCSDGNACTQIDSCQAGVCAGSAPVVCPASTNSCHSFDCDPNSGACLFTTAPDGVACVSPDSCDFDTHCIGGLCGGGYIGCGDPGPCWATSCGPHLECIFTPIEHCCSNGVIEDGENCDDGNYQSDDGCSRACLQEAGSTCTGEPSVCTSNCGDGICLEAERTTCQADCWHRVQAVAIGNGFLCGMFSDGGVRCLGANGSGQLGAGSTEYNTAIMAVEADQIPRVRLGTGRRAVALAAADSTACALLDNGQVKCWGSGAGGMRGAVGHDDRGDEPGEMGDTLPALNLGPGRTATQIAMASTFGCALLDNGTVKCWGQSLDPWSTLLGFGNEPTDLLGFGPLPSVQFIAVSDGMICGAMSDQTVQCLTPDGLIQRDAFSAISLAVGYDGVCAIDPAGAVSCWLPGSAPRPLSLRGPAVRLLPSNPLFYLEYQNWCAVLADGGVQCSSNVFDAVPTVWDLEPSVFDPPLAADATIVDLVENYGTLVAIVRDGSVHVVGRGYYTGLFHPGFGLALACGNDVLDAGEDCDDGDMRPNDGCDEHCHVEVGFACSGTPSVCVSTCGDGIMVGAETCDDGNLIDGDGCSGTCALEPGFVCAPTCVPSSAPQLFARYEPDGSGISTRVYIGLYSADEQTGWGEVVLSQDGVDVQTMHRVDLATMHSSDHERPFQILVPTAPPGPGADLWLVGHFAGVTLRVHVEAPEVPATFVALGQMRPGLNFDLRQFNLGSRYTGDLILLTPGIGLRSGLGWVEPRTYQFSFWSYLAPLDASTGVFGIWNGYFELYPAGRYRMGYRVTSEGGAMGPWREFSGRRI